MSKVRILFVIESLNIGGAEKSLVTVLQKLSSIENLDIHLLRFVSGGDLEKYVPQNVTLHRVNLPQLSIYQRLKFFLARKLQKNRHNAQKFWRLIENKIPPFPWHNDISIAYNQGLSTYYVAKYVDAKKKFAWINTDYEKAGYNIHIDYPFYKQFNKVICVAEQSHQSFRKLLHRYNLPLETDVIVDMVDCETVRKLSKEKPVFQLDKKVLKLVTVARLDKSKGLDLAINACDILCKKGYPIKWYVVGEGPMRKSLERLITQKKLNEKFILLGALSNPYPVMAQCDIYVQTSVFEGLGMTLMEAKCLHKPIVTTNFPTAYEIIKNEKCGLICEKDSKAIAHHIEMLMTNSQLRENLVEELKKEIDNQANHSFEKIMKLVGL